MYQQKQDVSPVLPDEPIPPKRTCAQGLKLSEDGHVELLQDILPETRLDPQRLELEVTETSIIADRERALHTLRRVKERDVTVAIDDFGPDVTPAPHPAGTGIRD